MNTEGICGTGLPLFYRPCPRRLEKLTSCRWSYKDSTFAWLILSFWVFEPAASRMTARCPINWATGALKCQSWGLSLFSCAFLVRIPAVSSENKLVTWVKKCALVVNVRFCIYGLNYKLNENRDRQIYNFDELAEFVEHQYTINRGPLLTSLVHKLCVRRTSSINFITMR